MKLTLTKKPTKSTIIVGFPGFGLIGTIATKFLIEHLDCERIGCIESDKFLPLAAIHKEHLIGPLEIFYNKKYNLVILQTLSQVGKMEWQISDLLVKMAKDLKAKEMIILEGTQGEGEGVTKVYGYNSGGNVKKLNLDPLKEGVLMGVTATLLLKAKKNIPVSCIFAEAKSQLPDTEAAAEIIKVLDKYIGMDVNFKPLLETAKRFESKLKDMMAKQSKVSQEGFPGYKEEKGDTDYLG